MSTKSFKMLCAPALFKTGVLTGASTFGKKVEITTQQDENKHLFL